MILKHKCGKPCLIDLNSSISVLAIPAILGNKINTVSLIIDKKRGAKPVFYCKYCETPFGENDLIITCIECDKPIMGDILLESPFGGILCEECVNKFNIVAKKLSKANLVLE